MESDAHAQLKQKRFDALLQAGKEALQQGDRRAAHDFWREAATLDPYNEKVWLALYRVLTSDEDRIVCLRNIIAINPMNVQARRRLNAFEEQEAGEEVEGARMVRVRYAKDRPTRQQRGERGRSRRLVRTLLIVLLILIAAALAAVVIGILLNAR